MLSQPASRTVRSGTAAGRSVPGQRLCAPISSRGSVRTVRVQAEEGFFPDAFKAALQTALERDPGASAGLSGGSSGGYGESYSNSSRDYGYSRSEPAYRPTAQPVSSPAGPMMQILATALVQSRQTLERLQAEEAEIENLIQKERKQVERLEWLLEKVQQDYAYFDQLQKRFEQGISSSSSSSSSSRDTYSSSAGYDNSSAYDRRSGYDNSSSSGGNDRSTPGNGSSSGSRFANYY